MNLIETLRDYRDNIWPQYYIIAGEHKFACTCAPCTIFLADGLETTEDCQEWQKLRNEECPMEHNDYLDRPMGIPTGIQIEHIHSLAARFL